MRARRVISVVDSHTAGEPTRVVVGGIAPFPGHTLAEREQELLRVLDPTVRLLCGEPRGHAPMHAVLPQPPGQPGADVAFLIVSALGSLAMCGHALIGAVTTLLEVGVLPMEEPLTRLSVETLAGLIGVEAEVSDGRVRSVRFENAPSWVLAQDVRVEVPEVGEVELDIAYGGLWYAIVQADRVGLEIQPTNVPRLVALSHVIRGALNARLADLVPLPGAPSHVPQVLFTSPGLTPGADGRNMATSTQLGFDRSPCGTGSSARMALHHARGELPVGATFVHESVIGTRFMGRVERSHEDGHPAALVPSIRGSAHLTALSQLLVDPDDPLGEGFLIPAAGGAPSPPRSG